MVLSPPACLIIQVKVHSHFVLKIPIVCDIQVIFVFRSRGLFAHWRKQGTRSERACSRQCCRGQGWTRWLAPRSPPTPVTSAPRSPSLTLKATTGGRVDGWLVFSPPSPRWNKETCVRESKSLNCLHDTIMTSSFKLFERQLSRQVLLVSFVSHRLDTPAPVLTGPGSVIARNELIFAPKLYVARILSSVWYMVHALYGNRSAWPPLWPSYKLQIFFVRSLELVCLLLLSMSAIYSRVYLFLVRTDVLFYF